MPQPAPHTRSNTPPPKRLLLRLFLLAIFLLVLLIQIYRIPSSNRGWDKERAAAAAAEREKMATRLPTVFIPHGGGPFPLPALGPHPSQGTLPAFLQRLGRELLLPTTTRPASILLISAHWEERRATLTESAKPPLLFDYYGFPPEAYKVKYAAPGAPALAARAAQLLR